ncbi:hypothetical protein [Streptomyces sp. NPDC059850]|uniref:hypothetical protein n=1 Tax=Streptomyces sp. NPDC059850 TaxID=3346970 RepID=UPI003661234F
MRAFRRERRREPAAVVHVRPTVWSRFLDHVMACPDCRGGERCEYGDRLHRAVRAALDTSAS